MLMNIDKYWYERSLQTHSALGVDLEGQSPPMNLDETLGLSRQIHWGELAHQDPMVTRKLSQ